MADSERTTNQRRLDLDWIRIGAFALLILYHVGMLYVPWEWHVKSAHQFEWLEPVMALTNPWRLTLLFVVSGAASRFMLDKLGSGAFARVRTFRLLVPMLFGMLVVVPPQTWLQVAQLSGGQALPYGEFYSRYISSSGGWSAHGVPLATPTWNHLWFVAYLLAYTLLLSLVCAVWPDFPRASSVMVSRLSFPGGFAAVAAFFVFVRVVLHPRFPETYGFVGDWAVHAGSVAGFLFGFAAAKAPKTWAALERHRRLLGTAAIAANLAYAGTLEVWTSGLAPATPSRAIMTWAFGIDQWFTATAILGYASAYLRNCDHPWRRYLTQAIFPYYIVHQTVIIASASALRPLALAPALEAILIVLFTAAGCFTAFEIARRLPLLGPLVGLK